MSIVKNEIPILEFDTEQSAVLNPTHENLGLKLPKKCVFAFLGAYIDEYANKTNTKQVSTFVSATKDYPIYITKYEGEEIVLCQAPVGSAPATQLLDYTTRHMGNHGDFNSLALDLAREIVAELVIRNVKIGRASCRERV